MAYLLKKIFRIISTRIYARSFEPGVVYKLGTGTPSRLVLDHTNVAVMHLGDILFFIEIVQLANQSSVDVVLVGSKQLFPLLSCYGVSHAHQLDDIQPSIVLTKNDSPLFFSESNHTVLGFNFWGLSGNGPVAGLVQGAVKRFCTQVCPSVQFVDQTLDFNRVNQSLYHNNDGAQDPDLDVVLVNSFVSSQRISTFFRQRAFFNFVQDVYENGEDHLVLIGAEDDVRKKVLYLYHEDKRGAYSIKDIMLLMSSGKVKYVITYDTFIAHLATMYKIPLKLFVKSTLRIGTIKERFVPFSQYFPNKTDYF